MSEGNNERAVDVLVIGAGQSGLAAGFYLQRLQRDRERGRVAVAPSFAILDAGTKPGGAWQHYWPSMELFSPAGHSSLPGRQMPAYTGPANPDAEHVVGYLTDYERRYGLPIHRPVRVTRVLRCGNEGFRVLTDDGAWRCRYLISATGSWDRPHVPALPGSDRYSGAQLHTRDYAGPDRFAGAAVVVVGAGNSGAQIAADLLPVAASVLWTTSEPPRYMPDDVDGRVLFQLATARKDRLSRGQEPADGASLGKIVAVPAVRSARDAGKLRATPMFDSLAVQGPRWTDGSVHRADAIIWCTGFLPNLAHLGLLASGDDDARMPPVTDRQLLTRSAKVSGLYFLGYGDWCGAASATLIGVGSWARETVADIARCFGDGAADQG